jgi:hypothetical protein
MRFVIFALAIFVCAGVLLADIDTRSDVLTTLVKQSTDINPRVLSLALQANSNAERRGLLNGKNVITVIDFSLPSTQKRLWTFDLTNRRLLFEELVAHGKNSGENRTVRVSNDEGSLMTSEGVFLTDVPYIGKNGYSLRLKGLEKGINDNVYSRAVVLHGAPYVSEATIHALGRLGRSWGCPAVRKESATPLINTIKEGTLLFAYYPDQNWLAHSQFLSATGGTTSDTVSLK